MTLSFARADWFRKPSKSSAKSLSSQQLHHPHPKDGCPPFPTAIRTAVYKIRDARHARFGTRWEILRLSLGRRSSRFGPENVGATRDEPPTPKSSLTTSQAITLFCDDVSQVRRGFREKSSVELIVKTRQVGKQPLDPSYSRFCSSSLMSWMVFSSRSRSSLCNSSTLMAAGCVSTT